MITRGFLLLALGGCMTVPTTRPLPAGQHQTSITLGGPMVRVPNGPTIPLPNISLEHQRGINERADW